MPRPKPPHLYREKTRHGRFAYYVRVGHGPRVRMRDDYGTSEFWRAYRLAVESAPQPQKEKEQSERTLSWLIALYLRSAEWSDLSAATRKQRHAQFKVIEETAGGKSLDIFNRVSILASRDARRDRPHAANNFLKAMRGLFGWALERRYVPDNPTIGVKLLSGANDDAGFHAWTEEELFNFEERWPLGSRQRLAFDLLLYTGLRRGDVVRLGRQHVRGGEFTLRTEKTGAIVTRPVLPQLAASIEATRTGDRAFIVTERGSPFTKESFGIWFKKACVEAASPGSAHGLRKAGARRAAEAGATEAQLNALFGWAPGSRESATYTRTANNARLARSAPVLPPPKSRTLEDDND